MRQPVERTCGVDKVHMIVGTLVLIAYLVLTIVNVVQWKGNRALGFALPLSRVAGLLLAAQWALGFSLLAGDASITPFHYIIGLATFLTLGAEHSGANSRESAAERYRIATLATAGTTILVLVAYLIGQSSG